MKLVNIHVGHFKTGTTVFQQVMSAVRERLAAAGVSYPKGAPAAPYQQGHALGALTRSGSTKQLEEILQQFHNSGAETLILSGEVVSASPRAGILALIETLKRIGYVRIVYSVRDWATYLPSRYAQNCKRSDAWTWWEYLEATQSTFALNADVNYALNIETFASSGADEFRLNYYRPGHAVMDTLDAMELRASMAPLALDQGSELAYNIAPNSDTVEATRILNAVMADISGGSPDRFFQALLRRANLPDAYELTKVAAGVMADVELGPELRTLIDRYRESPGFVSPSTRSEWLETLADVTRKYSVQSPPAHWYYSNMPSSHQPSKATVVDLPPKLRSTLARILGPIKKRGQVNFIQK